MIAHPFSCWRTPLGARLALSYTFCNVMLAVALTAYPFEKILAFEIVSASEVHEAHAAPSVLPEESVEKKDAKSTVKEAQKHVKAALQSQTRALSLPAYSVSATGPNRIAVTGEKIANAIYDASQLDVQTDETSGQIFVIPRTREPVALFLTTHNQETYALTLVPGAVASQEILLAPRNPEAPIVLSPMQEGAPKKPFVSSYSFAGEKALRREVPAIRKIAIEKAHSYPQAIKNLLVTVARDEIPEGFAVTNRCGKDCEKRLVSETFEALVFRYQNTQTHPVVLNENAFYEEGVAAIAIERAEVRPGAFTRVFIVRHAPQPSQSKKSAHSR